MEAREGSTHGKAALGAVLGDDADARRLDDGADERTDVVVADLAHQPHLLHRFAADLAPLGEAQLLDADHRAAVPGHVGEHLVHAVRRHADQTGLIGIVTNSTAIVSAVLFFSRKRKTRISIDTDENWTNASVFYVALVLIFFTDFSARVKLRLERMKIEKLKLIF